MDKGTWIAVTDPQPGDRACHRYRALSRCRITSVHHIGALDERRVVVIFLAVGDRIIGPYDVRDYTFDRYVDYTEES